MDDVSRVLADLVAIPSVNPMGRDLGERSRYEAAMTAYLERFFHALGVSCERVAVAPGRDNVLARYDSPGSRKLILFDAHRDTVPTDGMTIPPFEPVIEGDRLYGRGACDVKGGMAAMLTAFARLVRERPRGAASVLMACTVDEEFTHMGSSRLAADRPAVDLAIVAEPTRLDVVNTHKGAVRWKARTRGVACHSSTPHLGDNAIYRMARVIHALDAYADSLQASTPDPILGVPTLSVGRIEGGQSVNIVPDWCEIEIDRRVLPRDDPAACPGQVLEFVHTRLGDLEGIEFLPPWLKMPALRSNVPEETLRAICDTVERVVARRPRIGGVPYGTDAGPLGQAGIPCVVLGPGDIAQAHTKDEWISLGELRAAVDIYFELAKALG